MQELNAVESKAVSAGADMTAIANGIQENIIEIGFSTFVVVACGAVAVYIYSCTNAK